MKKIEIILSLLLIVAIVTLVIYSKPTEIKQDITSGDVHKEVYNVKKAY